MENNAAVTIRPEAPADYPGIRKANKKAFKRKEESKLVDAMRESENFIPALSLVAELDGQVVGHILFSAITIKGPEQETPALALAPMCVLPEYQGRGIGGALLRRGLEACRELGHKLVVVVGHEDYYPRFGFVQAGEKGLVLPFEAPPGIFMVLELQPGALAGVSGEIIYPREFHEVE
ncbi:MAG: GNAT family N-acetyltransferase [Elusimicrobiales bacterium]